MAVPVPLPNRNPCMTSWNWRLARRQVYMSDFNTFQRVSSRPMPRVYVVPLGMSTKKVHPNSCRISPVRQMCWTMFTRHINLLICRRVFGSSLGYASRINYLKVSVQRWVRTHNLKGRRQQNAASTSASDGVTSLTWTSSTYVARGMPGGCGSYL